MYKTQNNNVTYIEDLPNLEEIEGYGAANPYGNYQTSSGMSHEVPPQYQKFIRNAHRTPIESGMAPQYPEQPPPQMFEDEEEISAKKLENTPSCLEIAEHVSQCPICSKFYNNDKSIHTIAIIMLSIICILLLKRVLNL